MKLNQQEKHTHKITVSFSRAEVEKLLGEQALKLARPREPLKLGTNDRLIVGWGNGPLHAIAYNADVDMVTVEIERDLNPQPEEKPHGEITEDDKEKRWRGNHREEH